MQDVGFYEKEGLDISRVGNPILDYIHIQHQTAFEQTKRESYDLLQKIDKLITKMLPELNKYATKKGGVFDIFHQKYSDGKFTGDFIDIFSKEFTDELKM